jgi:nitroreductase
MFNDLSSPLALLLTRRSGKARDMAAPGPDTAQLAAILGAATRVPDHGKLAPWRFIIVADDQRDALAAMTSAAYKADHPDASSVELRAIDDFAHQAPCLVVLLSTPVTTSHIPLNEQRASAGAAAMQLLNAAHASGFVANWLTGWACNNAAVLHSFGAHGAQDQITGFLFIGTPTRDLDERPRPDPAVVIRHWTP